MYHGRFLDGIRGGAALTIALLGFPALMRWANLWRTSSAQRFVTGHASRNTEATRNTGLKTRHYNAVARLGMGDCAITDGFFGEESLLADAVGDFAELPLVGTDGGQVIYLADEI
jgi:hypothetical protein